MANIDVFQRCAHEALLELTDGAAKLSADRIMNLLRLIPHVQIESGYSDICDSLWRLNETTKRLYEEGIENAVNSITLMKIKAEIAAGDRINLDDKPVEEPCEIISSNKREMISVAMIGEDGLSELRMLAAKMNTLLMNPEPTSETWKAMLTSGINETELLFQKTRLTKSQT